VNLLADASRWFVPHARIPVFPMTGLIPGLRNRSLYFFTQMLLCQSGVSVRTVTTFPFGESSRS